MQTQQYIRSTVNLPLDLHKKLKMEAINRQVTFSEVVVSRLIGKSGQTESLGSVLSFFKKIRQSGPSFDGAEAIRRNRDTGNI
ncbi:MAG: hypothetical protein UW68_C0016G0017 [Candidatus Collierbacteria bacterium GW2011_GWB1_44_6]|uniref:Uncharacterized protein n=2 Tax=Candidatus Collieribacteriota TaxID=1752725 RepID=A0A0G1LWE8_9BACT|nr:MAG: hypothetical protein UV68_C0017G0016 [Candidatus Collierbacteria bacterium GW2011_GWC2_43_12]KKT73137.1 MAG: hypothetical protein UW68_C0016G0017 [Candidatus Collierbacteria bacterium GW2011_GWB1_44_6]KKT82974.1 MAG: hypothetical protein UW80_C0025G0007 [Microgenomates group bacterium GW2011_GWC1_44_9]